MNRHGIRIIAGLTLSSAASMAWSIVDDKEYSFSVYNSTGNAITQILVSQNGKTWGEFELGQGIRAGGSEILIWDKSTNNERCKQFVKAVFASGEESAPARFNFCEDDLEVVF
jgi:hypothetical protein